MICIIAMKKLRSNRKEFNSRFAIMRNFTEYDYIAECIERRITQDFTASLAVYIINLFYQLEIISSVNYI